MTSFRLSFSDLNRDHGRCTTQSTNVRYEDGSSSWLAMLATLVTSSSDRRPAGFIFIFTAPESLICQRLMDQEHQTAYCKSRFHSKTFLSSCAASDDLLMLTFMVTILYHIICILGRHSSASCCFLKVFTHAA